MLNTPTRFGKVALCSAYQLLPTNQKLKTNYKHSAHEYINNRSHELDKINDVFVNKDTESSNA